MSKNKPKIPKPPKAVIVIYIAAAVVILAICALVFAVNYANILS